MWYIRLCSNFWTSVRDRLPRTKAAASFLVREEKRPYVRLAIRKTDTLKVLLMLLWETKSLDNKKYAALSVKVEEIGKMLGGWNGQLTKLDPAKKRGEK